MKGRWAAGIPPRNFAWVIRDRLAVCERPGGYARNHRRVRRQEEIIWLRENGFTLVVSLLDSPHNLHAYDEAHLPWSHVPFGVTADPRSVLPDLYDQLDAWLAAGEQVMVHEEELGDRLMGVVGGYLLWADKLARSEQAIAAVEQILRRQMGPVGRELVALVASMPPPAARQAPPARGAAQPAEEASDGR